MIKRWMGGVAILPAVIAGSALAAPPAPVPYSWTGFYVGANAGGAWGRFGSGMAVDCSPPGNANPFPYICWAGFPGDAALVSAAGTGTIIANGFTGGVQAGYNRQTGNIVAGIESDFGAFQLRGTRQVNGTLVDSWFGTPFTVTTSVSSDWLFTLRGRLGFAVQPNLLVYGTSGLAVTRIGITTAYSEISPVFPPGISGSFGASATKTGFAVGGGVEYALPSNWTVKAEYLYLGFGSVTANGAIFSPLIGGYRQALSTTADLTAHVACIGVNRRF